MNIRLAIERDIPALKALDAKGPFFIKELNEFHTVLDDDDFLLYFLDSRSIFIAESDSMIVGYLIAKIKEWMFHYRNVIWIEHIFVDPEMRRKGIAQSMLNFMISYYLKINPDIKKVISKILPENEASLNLSKKYLPKYQNAIHVLIDLYKKNKFQK